MSHEQHVTYAPRPRVAERYGDSERTIVRWQADTELGFPTPMDINGRKFFAIEELERWEKSRVLRKAA